MQEAGHPRVTCVCPFQCAGAWGECPVRHLQFTFLVFSSVESLFYCQDTSTRTRLGAGTASTHDDNVEGHRTKAKESPMLNTNETNNTFAFPFSGNGCKCAGQSTHYKSKEHRHVCGWRLSFSSLLFCIAVVFVQLRMSSLYLRVCASMLLDCFS